MTKYVNLIFDQKKSELQFLLRNNSVLCLLRSVNTRLFAVIFFIRSIFISFVFISCRRFFVLERKEKKDFLRNFFLLTKYTNYILRLEKNRIYSLRYHSLIQSKFIYQFSSNRTIGQNRQQVFKSGGADNRLFICLF